MRQLKVTGKMDELFGEQDPLECPPDLDYRCNEDEMECVKTNWKQIRTHMIRGKFLDIYHMRITETFDIRQILHGIFREQKTAFKINLAFGFILKNRNTGEMRYYYPSQNGYIFDKPVVISNEQELEELIESMEARDWMEEIRQQKPSSQWRIVSVCCIGIYIFKVLHVPIGRGGGDEGILPSSLKENRGLDALERSLQTGKVYKDNLCFFRCLARHKGFNPKNLEKKTKTLFVDYLKTIPEDERDTFEGVKMDDLPNLDRIFGINTFVYSLETTGDSRPVASLVHRPNKILTKGESEEALKLNVYSGHFSYVKCMKKYAKTFVCSRCGQSFCKDYKLTRHERGCEAKIKKVYPGGVHTPPKTIFDKIEEEGIHVHQNLKYSTYFATYDIEVYYPKHCDLPQKKPKLEFTEEHHLLSMSVASNVPGYEDARCFIVAGEGEEHAKQLVQEFITHLNDISDAAYALEQERYADLKRVILETLTSDVEEEEKEEEDSHGGEEVGFDGESEEEEEDEEEREEDKQFIDDSSQNKQGINFYRHVDMLTDDTPPSTSTTTKDPPQVSRRKTLGRKLIEELDQHLRILSVFGFNTGSYDLNVLKQYIIPHLLEDGIEMCIKRNQNYMFLQSTKLRFLDICNFLAPGISYAKFLKAYDCQEEKGFFPYEWISVEKLDDPSLPPHQAFYSKLRGENISEEDYHHCQTVWEKKGMRTVRDFLVWYNNSDVVPFVEAVEKMKVFWQERQIDMTQCISLPGLAFKFAMSFLKEPNLHLSVFDSPLLHDLFRTNMVGGPAIIFKRYAEANKTFLRGNPDKMCRKVVGYDANALYLWALSQPMPVGLYTHWKPVENDRFRPTVPIKEADEWLAWVETTQGVALRTRLNNSEKRLGDRQLPVDGYDAANNTPYQFMGCYWHGCPSCKDPHKKHPTRGGTYGEIYDTTMRNVKYLEDQGYQPVVQWECQWNKLKQTTPEIDQFLNAHFPGRKGRRKSAQQLLEEVRNGEFFGTREVDIHVPDTLRPKFEEMTPIFKNAEIGLEDIGEHMHDHAEEHGCMPHPRRALIGSYWANRILLATPLLQFYLEQGLVVTHIYRAIQWKADPCFERFGEFVSSSQETR